MAYRYSSSVIFRFREPGNNPIPGAAACHEGWYWSMIVTYESREISPAIHGRTVSLPARFSGYTWCRMMRPRVATPSSMTRSPTFRCISLCCRFHGFNVMRCNRECKSYFVAAVFCIRQVNIDNPVQEPESIRGIISPAV